MSNIVLAHSDNHRFVYYLKVNSANWN